LCCQELRPYLGLFCCWLLLCASRLVSLICIPDLCQRLTLGKGRVTISRCFDDELFRHIKGQISLPQFTGEFEYRVPALAFRYASQSPRRVEPLTIALLATAPWLD